MRIRIGLPTRQPRANLGGETLRVIVNDRVKMSRGKYAAQAVHAALAAYGIDHGRVVVLGGSPDQIKGMDVVVRDLGATEVIPFTVTAGASIEDSEIGERR